MLFSSLEIKNFRSINNDGIKINFDDKLNFYSLIGANNSGKSNILDALALVLGVSSGKFYNYTFSLTDFYNQDISQAISIKLTLHSPLEYRNVYQQACQIEGFVLEVKSYKQGESKGQIHTAHHCFGINGKNKKENPLMDSEGIYKPKKTPENDSIDNQRKPILAKDQLYKLGKFYFLDIDNLSSFLKVSGYGPLGRLFKIYRDDFQTDTSIYKYKTSEGEKQMPSKEAFKIQATRITDILKTEKLKEIETALSKNISEYLGLETSQKTTINLGLPNHDEIFESLTKLKIQESQKLEPLNLSDLGTGYLSLFRLAVIKTLAEMNKTDKAIYIIEEPEIYLHPHLRRFFYKTLKTLSTNKDEVIFSTHSEEFVNISDYKSIIRVDKSNGTFTKTYQVDKALVLDFDKINQKVKRKGNQEIFFAQHLLLSEGQDDKVVLDDVIEKKGIDCDAKSISVIDCDSKTQIPDYIKLSEALNINYFVIFDTDKGNASSEADTKKILAVLKNDKNKYQAFPDSLETALKTAKQKENWRNLYSIIENLDYSQIEQQFPDVTNTLQPFISHFLIPEKELDNSQTRISALH